MEVANGGKLYVETGQGTLWWVWAGNAFTESADPAATPTAISFSPAKPAIVDYAPAGAAVAQTTVTMSDGTSFFAGKLVLSGPDAAMFAVNGSNIVTSRALTPTDDGTHVVTVTVSQNGQSVSASLFGP
jgi:hypothetical protein